MIYLLWGILNIVIAVFFMVICFKATKLIREKIGMLASIVFVVGLLSFMGRSTNNNEANEPNSNQIKTWEFVGKDSLREGDTYFTIVDLDKTLVSTYQLGVKYRKEKKGNMPMSAYSATTGLVCGINWKPTSIIVNSATTTSRTFNYCVNGIVEWKLLGITTFTQAKDYKGIVSSVDGL